MRPLKSLLLALACLLSLPTFAEGAGGKNNLIAQLSARVHTCAKPEWPIESLRNEEEGSVILAFLIGLDGRVVESKIEKSSGHPLLDLAAQDGLAKCLFASPETIGRTEPTWTKMMYVWQLEAGETSEGRAARLEGYKKLAAAGDAEAIYHISGYYFTGEDGFEKNIPESMRLLRKSAELGNAHAQSGLAMALFAGQYVEKDIPQAIVWAKKAAAQGASNDQVALAMILGEAPEYLSDPALMFDMLDKAVAQGNPQAKVMLGIFLVEGTNDEKLRGLQLIIDAAEAQERMAQHELAWLYEQGDLLPQDLTKAKALYERSAAGGFGPAKDALLRLQYE